MNSLIPIMLDRTNFLSDNNSGNLEFTSVDHREGSFITLSPFTFHSNNDCQKYCIQRDSCRAYAFNINEGECWIDTEANQILLPIIFTTLLYFFLLIDFFFFCKCKLSLPNLFTCCFTNKKSNRGDKSLVISVMMTLVILAIQQFIIFLK